MVVGFLEYNPRFISFSDLSFIPAFWFSFSSFLLAFHALTEQFA